MGLYIVHKAITSIGGFIRVESKVDVGTKFIVTFPLINHHSGCSQNTIEEKAILLD